MSSVIISGDTSGAVTVSAPAVAGTNTLTLQAATATNAVNKLETAITASTATIDITGIPSWAKRISILFSGVSLSGTSQFLFQLGTSGGFVSTGYTGAGARYGSASLAAANFTTGAAYANITTGIVFSGSTVFTNTSSNLWVWSGQLGSANATEMFGTTNGGISLGGALTQLRITTVGGTNTYSGTINILYEG